MSNFPLTIARLIVYLNSMHIIKEFKQTIIQWLRNNGPAPADVIAGHVLSVGSQSLNRTNQALRTLMREGRVAPIDTSEKPLRWSVTRVIAPQARVLNFR